MKEKFTPSFLGAIHVCGCMLGSYGYPIQAVLPKTRKAWMKVVSQVVG